MIYEIVQDTSNAVTLKIQDLDAWPAFDMLEAADLSDNVFIECWDGHENAITILKSGSQYYWM